MKPTPQVPNVDPVDEAEVVRRQLLIMVDTLDGLVGELRQFMAERKSERDETDA